MNLFFFSFSFFFTQAGPISNYYSKFLTIHYINFCTNSYFGVITPQYSINFQENLKVFGNGIPNSMIDLSHLTHQISFLQTQNCSFYCNVGILFHSRIPSPTTLIIKKMYKTNLKYEKVKIYSTQMMLQLLIRYPF